MYIISSYFVAVLFCIITMLCWGSWANTQKLSSKKWPFQLFYWDYALGILIVTLLLAFTLGSYGDEGRSFLLDIKQAQGKFIASALVSGIIFNFANLLLVIAIDIAGMAIAFPIGIGIALVLGVITNYIDNPEGNPTILFAGVLLIAIAVIFDALAYKNILKKSKQKPLKGIIISLLAGIAMGLIKEGDDFSVLSDILGDEDHLGDMDFKVAGTKDGITSLQMDIKITGITFEIMEQALKQAKEGRVHILGEMNKALSESRADVGQHTPKMEQITVDKKDIAAVIGKGGATIREIVEKSGAKVDVNDEGVVTVAAPDEESRNIAMQFIKDITAKAELNKIYSGKVMKIMEFGAFVNFLGKQDGLVHISELADKRVAKVTDVVKEGDEVKVKVIGFDRGKVKLSMKQANE